MSSVPRRRCVHSLCYCHEGRQREHQGGGAQEHRKSASRPKQNFDKRHLVPSYAVGTVVLLKNMKRNGRMGGKMEAHYSGPYEIMKELDLGVYCLNNLKTQKVMAKICNSMRFKVYHSDTGTSDSTSPGISDDPTQTTHRHHEQQQQHTHRGRLATIATPQLGGQ